MPLYEIPYCQRVINVSGDPVNPFGRRIEILHVDAVGVYVIYDEREKDKQLDFDFIRKPLVKRERGTLFIRANSALRAIKRFYIKYPGARIGGPQPEAKALWINKEKYITELPNCDLIHENKRKEFICGELSEEGDGDQGEWGMCVLENYPARDNCIISLFYKKLYEREKELNAIAVNVFLGKENFKVIQTRNILP